MPKIIVNFTNHMRGQFLPTIGVIARQESNPHMEHHDIVEYHDLIAPLIND